MGALRLPSRCNQFKFLSQATATNVALLDQLRAAFQPQPLLNMCSACDVLALAFRLLGLGGNSA